MAVRQRCFHLRARVKAKGGYFEHRVTQQLSLDHWLTEQFQPLPALMLILIAIVIYFSYQIDFDRVAFGICHFKGVV